MVIVDKKSSCRRVHHPYIEGVRLDLIFISLEQLEKITYQEIEQRQRIHQLSIAESMVIFDKTGSIRRMQEKARQLERSSVSQNEQYNIQCKVLHYHDVVERDRKNDPYRALLFMHTNLLEILSAHYRLQRKWGHSTQHILIDLRSWDTELTQLIETFVTADNMQVKFNLWSAIIDYVLKPLGGRNLLPPHDHRPCNRCQPALALLAGK
jgi:hypothetical protein